MYEVCGACGEVGMCSGACTQSELGSCSDVSWASGGVSNKAICRNGTHFTIHYDRAACEGDVVAETPELDNCYVMDATTNECHPQDRTLGSDLPLLMLSTTLLTGTSARVGA
jgi:hypothetical protein